VCFFGGWCDLNGLNLKSLTHDLETRTWPILDSWILRTYRMGHFHVPKREWHSAETRCYLVPDERSTLSMYRHMKFLGRGIWTLGYISNRQTVSVRHTDMCDRAHNHAATWVTTVLLDRPTASWVVRVIYSKVSVVSACVALRCALRWMEKDSNHRDYLGLARTRMDSLGLGGLSGVASIGPGQAMARPLDMIGRARSGRWPDVARRGPTYPASILPWRQT